MLCDYAENKWKCYKELAEKMCKTMTPEEFYAWHADISNEMDQWEVRCFVDSKYTEKAPDEMELIKYLVKNTVALMVLSHKVDSKELYNMIEENIVKSYMEKFA